MKNTKFYAYSAVMGYVNNFVDGGGEIDILEGCLLDTYILYHDSGVIEVWEEAYVNEWNSAYVRHIYRSGKLPSRFEVALWEDVNETEKHYRAY